MKRHFFLMSTVAGVLLASCLTAPVVVLAVDFRRAEPTLSDVHAATCRVRVSNARGTGIFNGYNSKTGKAYISTNDHVTSANRSCILDFWTNSKMESVQGVVVYKSRNDNAGRDFSIIEVDADALKAIDPPYIPMKALDASRLQGRTFMSSGCPDGRFDQGWRGTIERVDGGMAIFSPPPVPGQSGSGICVVENGRVYDVAKLTYLLGSKGLDESKGGALPLVNLVQALDKTNVSSRYEVVPVADDGMRVLAFTSADCQACVNADDGLTIAEHADGVVVERVDALSKEGGAVANKYDVSLIPCYVVVDSLGAELARATPDDISRLGAREAVTNAWTRAKVLAKPKASPVPLETPQETDAKTYRLGTENGIVVSAPGEVEKTIAVYITDPSSYDFDAERVATSNAPSGLLRDLLERDAPPTVVPRQEDGLTTRALDTFVDKLGERMDKTVDGAFTRAEGVLEDAKKDIEKTVVQTVGDKIQASWSKYRVRLIALVFGVVFVAVLSARAVATFFVGTWGRVRRAFDVLRAANEAARNVINEAKK